MALGDMDLEKSSLALLAGFGLVAIIGFFVLFMRDKSNMVLSLAILIVILSAMTMLFYLLDKLRFCPAFITDKNSNLLAGMLFAITFLVIIFSFTELLDEAFDGILIVVLAALTFFSVFLLEYSIMMED